MPQESQLAHRVLGNLALPYITNVSPANTDPHFVLGSTDILTSINSYAERRPGFAATIETTPTTFNNLQRTFPWDRFDGTFYVMFCDINVSGFAQVYKYQVGVDTSAVSIFTDTGSNIPFDFVVSNNTVYFSNGHVAKKWDPVNGISNWGISISNPANSVANYVGNGADGGGGRPWTNPSNEQGAPDGVFATNSITSSIPNVLLATNALNGTQYGFSLPAGAVITGIQATITGFAALTLGSHATGFSAAALIVNGSFIGSGKSVTLPLTNGTVTIGGPTDTWGATLTTSTINNTTFGMQFFGTYRHDSSPASTTFGWSIDAVQLTVFFTGGPVISVSGSAGAMTATAGYTYEYCYGNSATGHISSPTLPSFSTGVFTNKLNVAVTLTASTDPQVNQIHVFRTTDGGGGTYFELPSSPFANTSTNILDSATDASLNALSIAPTPTFNDPPTPFQGAVYFSGRIWGFLNNKVYFSGLEEINQGVPEESFPSGIAGNFWSFDEPVQGLGVAGVGANQTLGILCGGRLYGIQGNTLDTFRRFLVSNRRGCRNRTCVTSLGGMMAWLDSANQVWATDGNSLEELSTMIRPDLAAITPATCSMTFHTAGRFHWLVLSTGTKLFVYDVDQDQWMPPWIFSANYILSGETSPGNYVLMAATNTQGVQMSTTHFYDRGESDTVLASDNFNRANQNPINTNWKSLAVDFVAGQVFSNQYIGQDASFADVLYDGGISWTNDQFSQATLITLNVGKGLATLGVREHIGSGGIDGDAYVLVINDGGTGGIGVPSTVLIQRNFSGAATILATGTITPNSGDIFRIQVIGPNIDAFQNGVLILTATDSNITSGRPGLGSEPIFGVAADVAWDNWSGGLPLGGTYAPVMKVSLLSVIPDYGSRFSYIGMGSYNEPTRTGVPYTFQVTNNGQALGDFLILTDEDPTMGSYTSIAANLVDTSIAFNRTNGTNLKQLVYQTTQPASRWVSMQVKLASADQVDNLYELFMAYKPLGGR